MNSWSPIRGITFYLAGENGKPWHRRMGVRPRRTPSGLTLENGPQFSARGEAAWTDDLSNFGGRPIVRIDIARCANATHSDFNNVPSSTWQERNNEERLRTIAAALGVAPTTLQRWARASRRARFRSIEVRAPKASTEATSVAILITEAGSRVEGLTIESAARLLTLLR